MGLFGESASTERKQNLAANKDLAQFTSELEYLYGSYLWENQFKATNEYNTPLAQLDRLYDAGINPLSSSEFGNTSSASVGGSVHAGTGVSTSTSRQAPNVLMALEQLSNTSKTLADTSKLQSETKNINAQTPFVADMNTAQIRKLMAEYNKTEKDSEVSEEQRKFIKEQTDAIAKNLEFRAQELQNQLRSIKIQEQGNRINEFTSNWQKDVANYNSVTDRMNAQTNLSRLDFDRTTNYEENVRQFNKTLNLKYKELRLAVAKQNWQQVVDMMGKNSVSLDLGSKYLPFKMNVSAENKQLNNTTVMLGMYHDLLSNDQMPYEYKRQLIPLIKEDIDTISQQQILYEFRKQHEKPLPNDHQ